MRTIALLWLFAAAGAEPFYFGAWKIESAVVAPWWVEKAPPDPVSVKALTGRTINFSAKSITAPKLLACASPRYAVKEYPADYLFQGGFGEMNRRDRSVDPVKIAASVGFRGSKWKTLETGCDFDFHFIDERTAAFALDNYIYRLKKQ